MHAGPLAGRQAVPRRGAPPPPPPPLVPHLLEQSQYCALQRQLQVLGGAQQHRGEGIQRGHHLPHGLHKAGHVGVDGAGAARQLQQRGVGGLQGWWVVTRRLN